MLKGHKSKILSLHVDCNYIISASSDKTIRLWNSSNGNLLNVIDVPSKIRSVFVMNDTIFTCADDGYVRSFNIHTGKCTFQIKSNNSPITDIYVHNEKLITAARDGEIKMIDLSTQSELDSFICKAIFW